MFKNTNTCTDSCNCGDIFDKSVAIIIQKGDKGDKGEKGDKGDTLPPTPVTFLPINLTTGQQEVIITWSNYTTKHGSRPVYIDLYQVTSTGTVQSTARVYSEDNGLTYKWYVGTTSPREYEVRILGYTTADQPIPPIPSLGFPYTFPFTLS